MAKGKENVYTCQKCGGMVTTVDIDEGVTPFMLQCRSTGGCDGFAYSAMYPTGPRPPHVPPPSLEWYKPNKQEIAAMPKSHREHYLKGGLNIRPRSIAVDK